MILALIAFTYTAINFPTTMRDLLAGAKHAQDGLSSLGLPDSYMVWVDIFLQPNQIVLVGFAIAMRFVISIIGAMFTGGGSEEGETHSSSRSEKSERYRIWGKSHRP